MFWILQTAISFAAFGMCSLDANGTFCAEIQNLTALGIGE